MSQIEANKIKIGTVTGGADKDELKKCYFYPATSPYYDFYKKENGVETLLASNVQNGYQFTFSLGGWTWTVPDPNQPNTFFQISGTGPTATASGSWHNTDTTKSIENDPTGESGTFQAQAGQTIDPEAEDGASAAKA